MCFLIVGDDHEFYLMEKIENMGIQIKSEVGEGGITAEFALPGVSPE